MAEDRVTGGVRRPRADAVRNRTRLIAAAKPIFAAEGMSASLDEIARRAGVGIGTLYRHFPTRDALVQAVYLNETQQLAEAADDLGQTRPPVEALRAWMRLFVDYIATKQGMAEMLTSLPGGTSELYAVSGAQISKAVTALVDRAVDGGKIRLGLEPFDLLRALAGVANANAGPNWEPKAKRLVDILIDGVSLSPK